MAKNYKGTKTLENLAKAFAAECQAGARYQFIAEKAQKENLEALMQEVKKIAKNEMAHAKIFYNYLTENCTEKIDDIKINAGFPFKCGELKDDLYFESENEKSESEKIYPAFAKTAEEEGFTDVAASFTSIAMIENGHRVQLEQLSKMVERGTMYKEQKPVKWKCSHCGHEETSVSAWQVCPVCGYPQGYVQLQAGGNKD